MREFSSVCMAQRCPILSMHLLLPGPSSLVSLRAPPLPCFSFLPLPPLTQKPILPPTQALSPHAGSSITRSARTPSKNTRLLFQPKGPKAFLGHMQNQLLLPEKEESKTTWSKQLLWQKAEILHCSQMLSHQHSCNQPASS